MDIILCNKCVRSLVFVEINIQTICIKINDKIDNKIKLINKQMTLDGWIAWIGWMDCRRRWLDGLPGKVDRLPGKVEVWVAGEGEWMDCRGRWMDGLPGRWMDGLPGKVAG